MKILSFNVEFELIETMKLNEEFWPSLKMDFFILNLHEKEKIKFLNMSFRAKFISLISINNEC